MPENKVDPFAPQGEILGQTLTVRVDVSAPSDQRRRDGVNRTHSEASSAPRESLERQSSFGSGSDYEDARNAYIRGSLLMRDGDYRGAKSLLEQAGRSFHKMGLRREEDSAVAQLKELDMAILREGRGRDMDGMGMGNQQEALFRQLSRELSQGIERERTKVEIDALHKAAVEAMPVVHEETQAEKLEKARAGRRNKVAEPSKEQKEAMRKLEEEAAKEEARIEAVRSGVEKQAHAEELLDAGEVEAARKAFVEVGQMWMKAGMLPEAASAKRGVDAASNIMRSVADSKSGMANSLLERPGDPDVSSLREAQVMMERAEELWEEVGDLREARRARARSGALREAREGVGSLGKGKSLTAEERLGDAMGELWKAEAALEKAFSKEAGYWVDPT